jgi:hypothetical protein
VDVLITEMADPNNADTARYFELFNPCDTPQSLDGYKVVRFTNANPVVTSEFMLTGITIPAKGFLILCRNKAMFDSTYAVSCDWQLGAGGPADSNGDDNIAIMLVADNSIVDVYGVPGTDGTGEDHEFEDGRAARKAGTVRAAVWTAADWTIDNDSSGGNGPQNAPGGFDPKVSNAQSFFFVFCPRASTKSFDQEASTLASS